MYKIISYLFIFFAVLTSLGKADIVDKLTDLNNLYKEGALNEEEFIKAKEILLKTDSEKINKEKITPIIKAKKPLSKKIDQDLSKLS